MKPFGVELLLDCYNCSKFKINDLNTVYKFLDRAVEVLGVTKQSPPFVFHSPDGFPDKAGISSWVPLIESGIQCHTLTPKRFVSIDYYTCGDIDEDMKQRLIETARDFFEFEKCEVNLVKRGINYYND